MTEEDLYRFAVYHFSASRVWNDKIQDIIFIMSNKTLDAKTLDQIWK